MGSTLDVMSKPKPSADRHKPRRMVGIPERLAVALEKAGEARLMNLTDVVREACLDYLTKLGAWPPPKKS